MRGKPSRSRTMVSNWPEKRVAPRPAGARAKPFVEFLAVDHADKAAIDGHVDACSARRDHRRHADSRLQQVVRNVEISDQPRRDSAAARLDAPALVDQRDLAAEVREIIGSGGPCRASADDNHVENLLRVHDRCAYSQGLVAIAPGRVSAGLGASRRRAARDSGVREPPRQEQRRATMKATNRRRVTARTRTRGRHRRAAVAKTPPRPNAIACAAPQSPIRVPSRDAARRLRRQTHHRADRRDREDAVGNSEREARRRRTRSGLG